MKSYIKRIQRTHKLKRGLITRLPQIVVVAVIALIVLYSIALHAEITIINPLINSL